MFYQKTNCNCFLKPPFKCLKWENWSIEKVTINKQFNKFLEIGKNKTCLSFSLFLNIRVATVM